MAVTGGLVANGEGANVLRGRWKGRAGEEESDKGEFAVTGGAGKPGRLGGESAPPPAGPELAAPGELVAADVTLIGGAPELNSAQRGHFLFVSKQCRSMCCRKETLIC